MKKIKAKDIFLSKGTRPSLRKSLDASADLDLGISTNLLLTKHHLLSVIESNSH